MISAKYTRSEITAFCHPRRIGPITRREVSSIVPCRAAIVGLGNHLQDKPDNQDESHVRISIGHFDMNPRAAAGLDMRLIYSLTHPTGCL
jgi:hypothetical protein